MTHCHASSLVLPWVFLENKCNGRTLPEKSPSADLLNGPKDALLCFSSPQKTNGNLKEETCSCSTTSSSLSLTRSASLFFFSLFYTLVILTGNLAGSEMRGDTTVKWPLDQNGRMMSGTSSCWVQHLENHQQSRLSRLGDLHAGLSLDPLMVQRWSEGGHS